MSDPSFGLPPEIPTGTSTPVPDAPTPVQNISATEPPVNSVSGVSDVPKFAPAPAPAPAQSMPIVSEPPFEQTTAPRSVGQTPFTGIPLDRISSAPRIQEKPVTAENIPPPQYPPQPTPATDHVTEAVRRASIRTLESDAAETIHKQNLSVSSIALAQQASAEKIVRDVLPEEKSHTLPWVLGGVGLAVLGVIVVTVAYIMQTNAPLAPVVVTPQDALIPGVEETTLDVTDMTRTKLSQTLEALPSAYAQKDGISLVRLVTYTQQQDAEGNEVRVVENVSPESFFRILSARNTDRLERSLGAFTYFGVISSEGKTSPFIAFEVTSYESAFAGLLEWESALPEDISFIVRAPAPLPEPIPLPVATTTSTTTPSTATTTAPQPTPVVVTSNPTPVFKDLTVKNKDVRAYVGTNGQTRVLYSFLSQKLLIIAQDETTITTLVDHISTARFSR